MRAGSSRAAALVDEGLLLLEVDEVLVPEDPDDPDDPDEPDVDDGFVPELPDAPPDVLLPEDVLLELLPPVVVPLRAAPPDEVLLVPEMGTGTVLLTMGTGAPVPAGEVAAACCEVTTDGCVVTTEGCPVTTPAAFVWVRKEVKPFVYDAAEAEAEAAAPDWTAPAELAALEAAGPVDWAMAAAAKVRITAERMVTEVECY